MIEVPGYLAKQLEKEAAEKKPKKAKRMFHVKHLLTACTSSQSLRY